MNSSSVQRPRVTVLISGDGSNLQSLIDAMQAGSLAIDLVRVISNRSEANGLHRADQAGIPTHCIEHKNYASREAFDADLMQIIDADQPDLLVLAGFMRILTPSFVEHYAGKIMNIHPSLLPKYPGLNTHQRALEAGDAKAGSTVHFVTSELDGGPPIIQGQVDIRDSDTAATLAQRVKAVEHIIYPIAVRWFTTGSLRQVNGQAILNNKALPPSGHLYADQSAVPL